jgi:NADPH:quinone reductase-like Zn-dependent oxidoreductase
VVLLPDTIPDEVGAQVMINTVTALTVIRAAHGSLPPDARTGVVTLLTGAGSAVGRLTGKVLTERGVKVTGTLFEVAERYSPSRIAHAVAHVSRAGRTGVVLIDFSND